MKFAFRERSGNRMNAAIWLARLLVAGVFIYAGVLKLGASERFAITVAQFTTLPPAAIAIFASTLPWLELLAGLLLLIPRTARAGALLAGMLLVVFIAALTWARSQGLAVDCGCFGEEDQPMIGDQIPFALARDLILLALTLLLAPRRLRSPAD